MKKRQNKETQRESRLLLLVRGIFAIAVILVQLALPLAPAFADEVSTDAPPSSDISPSQNEIYDDNNDNDEVVETESESDLQEAVIDTTHEVEPDSEVTDSPVETSQEVEERSDTGSTEDDAEPSTEVSDDPLEGEGTPDPVLDNEEGLNETIDDVDGDTVEQETEVLDEVVGVPEEELVVDDIIEPGIEEETTLPEVEEELFEEIATTTEAATTSQNVVVPGLHTVSAEGSGYTFGLDDCARVADGSFYCTPESESREVPTDRVFGAPDADGDNEIFIEKAGVLTQLTHNLFDDAAPFYDEQSNTIVFHRLVEARYQILSLDLDSLEETQLTHDSYNNMQPSRYDGLIVWQGWVGNDWEILMSQDGEIAMLTDNVTHDIGPRINGEYIIWQAEELEGWKVRIYNTLTGETESIDDADGASIENPRLVLVYDAKHENGDIETRGYDLDTGKKVALAAQAESLPEEIPDPDQTGEERALINAVTQVKPKTDDDDTGEPEPLPLDPLTDDVASSTDALVIPPFDAESEVASSTPSDSFSLPSDIPDIVIPIDSTDPEAPDVPDLVIPPFVTSAVETPDSQEEVAGTH
jgi:hypothetical protein